MKTKYFLLEKIQWLVSIQTYNERYSKPSNLLQSFGNSGDNTYIPWLYVLIMSRTRFRVNPHSIVAWMSSNSLLETGAISEV